MSVVFDKLSFMRHLESDGTFPRPQAEKLSEAFHQAVQETVATKTDIQRLELRIDTMETRFDAKLGAMDARIDAKFAAMDLRIDAKLGAMDARIDAKFAAMDAKFAAMDAKFAAIDPKFDATDTKLTSMEARLEARLDATLASMKVWFAGGLVALFSALSAIRFFAH